MLQPPQVCRRLCLLSARHFTNVECRIARLDRLLPASPNENPGHISHPQVLESGVSRRSILPCDAVLSQDKCRGAFSAAVSGWRPRLGTPFLFRWTADREKSKPLSETGQCHFLLDTPLRAHLRGVCVSFREEIISKTKKKSGVIAFVQNLPPSPGFHRPPPYPCFLSLVKFHPLAHR